MINLFRYAHCMHISFSFHQIKHSTTLPLSNKYEPHNKIYTAHIYIRTTQWFILVIISNLMQILICYINFYIIYTSPCIYKNLILSTLYTHTHAHHMFFLFFFRPIVKLYAYVKFINIHVSHTTRTFFTSPSYNYQIEFH